MRTTRRVRFARDFVVGCWLGAFCSDPLLFFFLPFFSIPFFQFLFSIPFFNSFFRCLSDQTKHKTHSHTGFDVQFVDDENKYQTVLDVVQLTDDLKHLPGGDQCEIGDRGITLSGGQMQRLAIDTTLHCIWNGSY